MFTFKIHFQEAEIMAFLSKKLPDLYNNEVIHSYYDNFSILSEKDYNFFILNWVSKKCQKSRNKLILGHLPLVKKITKEKYLKNKEFNFEDLFSAGVCGLLISVNKFDYNHQTKLSTYARWWISSSLNEYIKGNWSQVKICTTESQRKLFNSFGKIKKDLNLDNKDNINYDDIIKISKVTKIKKSEIISFQLRFQKDLNFCDLNDFDDLAFCNESIRNSEFKNLIDKNTNLFQKKSICKAFSVLTEKEKKIIKMRYFSSKKNNRETIGKLFGVSDERIRQIEKKAKTKLLNFFKTNNLEKDLKICL